MRRVEEFSGVLALAYALMANHFHVYIYVPPVEDIGDDELLRRTATTNRFYIQTKGGYQEKSG